MSVDANGPETLDGVAAVHDRVRDAILSGELPAGHVISQVQLAQELGISRTPLREAIRMLQREGLIQADPNKRVRVAPFSIQDMEELYALRITVEALGVRLTVPQLTEADLANLDAELTRAVFFASRERYDAYRVPHRAFHAGLVAKSGDRIVLLLSQLSDHCERYRRMHTTQVPQVWMTSADEHRGILEACIERDHDLAARRLAEHLSHTVLGNIELLDPDYDPVALQTALEAIRQTAPTVPSRSHAT